MGGVKGNGQAHIKNVGYENARFFRQGNFMCNRRAGVSNQQSYCAASQKNKKIFVNAI